LNTSVFSWRRNAKYVDDVLIDEGYAFKARAAATGKARVARRVDDFQDGGSQPSWIFGVQ